MPVVLDPDAAAVFKAFREAGRPPYETLTPTEARDVIFAGRSRHQSRAPGAEIGTAAVDPLAERHDPGSDLYAGKTADRPAALRPAWCSFTAAAG